MEAGIEAVRAETRLHALGLTRVLSEATLVEFVKKCPKGLRLDWVKNFTRVIPDDVLEPKLLGMGLVLSHPEGGVMAVEDVTQPEYWEEKETRRPLSLPEMLKTLFDAKLETPEDILIQPKWVAAGLFEMDCDFYKFIRARDMVKNEGLVLRHLLRLTILADEFRTRSAGDPDYERIGELATRICRKVDPRYTDRFLDSEQEAKKLRLM